MSLEGEQLKALRIERELTQEELAAQSGIDRGKIAKIETDKRRMTATDAAYLARGLGVRVNDLVGQPQPSMHFRKAASTDETQADVERVAAWFADFVEDALYLERRARRYGLE